jgi:glycosyltransferase involved in cell wall biosynthesis
VHIAIVLGPFLPVPPVLGGAAEKAQLALAGAFRAAGHQVTVISRRYGGFASDETVDGLRHLRVRSSDRSRHLPVNLARGLRYALRAAAVLPPADVTVTNEFFLPLILPRARAGRIYVQVGRYPKYQTGLYFRADRLQAVSGAVAAAMIHQTPWVANKVKIIGCAIGEQYFGPLPPVERERAMLYVGRIAREKGIELLIDAAVGLCRGARDRIAEGWRLRIIGPHAPEQGGDGDAYLAELRERAAPLGADCVFLGPIFDSGQLIRHYQSSSVFVYPSLAERGEALGLAPLEAMACGCAVVVSGLRCFDDFLDDGATGLKFDHAGVDPAGALAGQLGRLMADPTTLQRIAAAGRQRAEHFSVAAIAEAMLRDFQSLIEERPAIRRSSQPNGRSAG